MDLEPERLLRQMLDAAIAVAQPSQVLPAWLPQPPQDGRVVVVGAGKAAAAMARAFEQNWNGPFSGLVVTRYGYAAPCERIAVIEAAHPQPDEASLAAGRQIMQMVEGLSEDHLVICLLSGGGSALMSLPLPGLTIQDTQAVNAALLRSGAGIGEINVVRRRLSAIKGGRLAAACHPARVVSLLISDVPGDDPVDIASGPTSPDPTTCADALAILERYGVALTPNLRRVLESGEGESVKPGDPRLARAETHLIATAQMALDAAAKVARAAGLTPHILGDSLEGEAREVGKVMAGIAAQVARRGEPFATPCVLLSGGETSVTVRGDGRGGRNVEFLLSLAIASKGLPGLHALAADTDGVDGLEEAAGAVIGPDTLTRARRLGLDAQAALDANDAHSFFEALGNQVITGPTLTNVNDFRVIVVAPPGQAPGDHGRISHEVRVR